MSSVEFVDDAAKWSKAMTHWRARGPGDLQNAMRGIEREYGIGYAQQWKLRYRKSSFKDIGIGLYTQIKEAYAAECERQERLLRHELEITKLKTGISHPAVVAASALVGEE